MKEGKDIFCNLCQKSFSNDDFMEHIPNDHLPSLNFSCPLCQEEQGSCRGLEIHLNTAHINDRAYTYKVFQFSQLFAKTSEILSHIIEGDEWILKSFSLGFDNVLSKKEIRALVKNSYNKGAKAVQTADSCELCNDGNTNANNLCCYCGQQFLQKCRLKNHVFTQHLQLPPFIKKAINLCDICRIICPNSKTLQQHKNRLHKKKSCKKSSEKAEKTPPFCHFCGKSLANKSNLKRHVLNQHSEEIGAPPSNNVFTCDYCKCFFSNKSSVKRHIENLHLKMKDTRKSISCFQCEQRFNSIKNLNAHLTIEHNVIINEEKLHFSNLGEFWEWKQDEEIRTNSRFIQLRGLRRQRRKGEEISTLKFVCNRSGIFHSKSNGKRAYRIKGSSKIGRYCSAYIEISFKDNALVDGIYCSTHSGHDNDLRYLTLTMDEKREIYEKIKSGATFSAILNEIRNNVGKEIKRKHLVTNKDLHNIVTTFKKLSKPPHDELNEESTRPVDRTSDHISDRNDRNFNNDLDICADLWVETCQRMINRFDQEPRSVHDLNKDNELKNITGVKNAFIDDHLLPDSTRGKITRVMNCNDFTRNTYVNNDYTPNGLAGSSNQGCFKPPHYSGYVADTSEPRIRDDLSYFPNVSRTASNNLEGKDFCGISTISNDLRLNKEFYPLDSLADERIMNNRVANDIKIPNVCPNGYTSMDSSVESNDSSYITGVNSNVYDKLASSNTATNPDLFASYSFSNRMPMAVNLQSAVCLPSASEDDDLLDDHLMVSDDASSDDEKETSTEPENEVSDLKDRVNSVTALYNIVESELDERKKNIIRNYVDNMFRVLQYRYNKCKTKKKQNTEKRSTQDKKPKKRVCKKQNKKFNESPEPKPSIQFPSSTNYTMKIDDNQCPNALNNSVMPNFRSDTNFMRWDQY